MTVGFAEDLDTSGGAAQLASLLQQRGGIDNPDADTIRLPDVSGMYLKAIRVADESGSGTGGYLHFVGKGDERKYRFGKDKLVGDNFVQEIVFPDNVFRLPKKQKIKCYANLSGSGAEQHAVLLDIYNPLLPAVQKFGNVPVHHLHMLGKKTGTLTAATPSGLGNPLTSLEDSEIQFSEDEKSIYAITRFGNYPGLAGVGVCGMRHQNGLFDRLFPAIIASGVKGTLYPLGWTFNGDSPPLMVGAGVVTTSTEYTLEIAQVTVPKSP